MPSRHEQLRDLNRTAEDNEEDCQHTMPSPAKAQSECEPSRRVNYEVFKDVRRAGFGPLVGRNQGQNNNRCRQDPSRNSSGLRTLRCYAKRRFSRKHLMKLGRS